MARCEHCGAELPIKTMSTRYCTKCGTKVPGEYAPEKFKEPPVPGELAALPAQERAARAGVKLGFSERIHSEEFQKAMGTANRGYVIMMAALALLLAPAVTVIAGLIKPANLGALIAACVIAELIILVVVIWFLVKRFAGKEWDGEVVAHNRKVSRSSNSGVESVTYITECVTADGKRRKHKEVNQHALYDYLDVGDEVRYHPRLFCPLEKYDKTMDSELVCPFCGLTQPIENDYCGGCGKPLLK